MKRLLSCEFNMDTACVELKFVDGSIQAAFPFCTVTLSVLRNGPLKQYPCTYEVAYQQ